MNTQVIYANEKYFTSFHEGLSAVARERVVLEAHTPEKMRFSNLSLEVPK